MVRRVSTILQRRTRDILAPAALVAVVLVAAWPLLSADGLLNTRGGGDSPFLLQRVQQLALALQDGHFPARWMPDAAYGYGYPFFNYYAPLSIYIAAGFRFLGTTYVRAIQLAQLLGFAVAAWACFRLALHWFKNEWAALLAAAAYTLAPFHLVNVYVRGDSLAEFWAMALYPLVLVAADGIFRQARGDRRRGPLVGALALSYAALVLSHNISALIFSPFVLLYVLLLGWREEERDRAADFTGLALAAVGLALGLALSAWFWLPALAETGLVQTGPVTQGYFHYSNHFRGADLVQPSLFFDYNVSGGRAFRMGLVQALLAVAGIAALLWRLAREEDDGLFRLRAAFVLFALALATFMITPFSGFLWERLPLLPYVQFPWRFLSVQALAGALVAGALALLPRRAAHAPWLALGGVGLMLLTATPGLPADYLVLQDADVTSERLAQYEWFTGNVGSTVRAEYLPATVQPRPYTSPWLNEGRRDQGQALEGEAQMQLSDRRATRQTWQVTVHSDEATLSFPTFYWPGWQALIDGEPASLDTAGNSGLIALEVPAGAHTVILRLGHTPVRLLTELLSVLAIFVTLALAAPPVLHALSGRAPALDGDALLLPGLLGVALLAVVLWWRFEPPPDPAQNALTWDFSQMGYLSHAPQGVRFDDGAVLVGYEYDPDSVQPGQTVRVVTEWAGDSGAAEAIVALHTPAVHRVAQAPALQEARQLLSPGVVIFELPIPEDAPAGLYAPRLERRGAQALTPAGQARGPLFLRPLRVAPAAVAAEREAQLQVRAERVTMVGATPAVSEQAAGIFDCAAAAGQTSAARLELHLAWRTGRPLADNYTVSMRLLDGAGRSLAQCDVQPGYGLRPSSGWTPGEWVYDRLALPLPPQLPPQDAYVLLVTLYERPGRPVLTRRLGEVVWEQEGQALVFRHTAVVYELPPGVPPVSATFGDVARLRGVEQEQTGDSLVLTLYWEALEPAAGDYMRFVHLIDAGAPQPLAQVDGMPVNNSYPTSQWTGGEIVADSVTLDLSDVRAGSYRLAVGFYPPRDPQARLPILDEQGRLQPDGRLLLPETVEP
ncbi:MAG TPA: 6-pyruvoyl-tetrahydropterin synthase-related protein [Candidatus Sulfomarinibacteraceae bacterium]|nr:6-pyruvoyl-tetrahydropterin synthase-related protein [Candidatus Sulfomarinibacteraceae bacterium]